MLEKLLVKGEKLVLSRINDPSQQMLFELTYPRNANVLFDFDIFAYLMDENGRAVKDNIIFYNNPSLEGEGITYKEIYETNQVQKSFAINLSKIPHSIQTICLTCTVYCKNRSNLRESMYTNLQLRAMNKTLRSHMFNSEDRINLVKDQVFILGDIYRHKDSWKYNAVKQELDEGLMTVMKKLYFLEIY